MARARGRRRPVRARCPTPRPAGLPGRARDGGSGRPRPSGGGEAVIEKAVAAIRAGRLAVVPTDTVYGLATTPYLEEPVRRLYRAKGRGEGQPTALVAADLEVLFECVP